MQALLLTRYYSGDQIRVRWLGLRERDHLEDWT